MTGTWFVVAMVGLGTMGIKALGPVILGGRALPERLTGVVELLAPALLAALVATQTFGSDGTLIVDERVIGLAAAAVALRLKAPVLVVLLVAAATTALARLVV